MFINVIELEYNCPILLTMVNIDIIHSAIERLGLLYELCNGCNMPAVVPNILTPVHHCICQTCYLLHHMTDYVNSLSANTILSIHLLAYFL